MPEGSELPAGGLTVLVNTNDRRIHAFASSAKEWYPLTGTLESTG